MADIVTELTAIANNPYGGAVREAIVDAAEDFIRNTIIHNTLQTLSKPTGFFAMDLTGKVVMRYKSPYILDEGECEGVFVSRDGSGDIYITAPKRKLRKLHVGS